MSPLPTPRPTAGRAPEAPRTAADAAVRSASLPRRAGAARLAALLAVTGGALLAACSDGGGTEPRPNNNRGVPSVGDTLRLNTRTDRACDTLTTGFRKGVVKAVTQRAVIVADAENPTGGLTDDEYRGFGAAFDSLVYPVDVATFGEPTDLDNNGRSVIFFTSAVNAETPRGADYIVGGFFWERDLFPRTGTNRCTGSNDAEMFYMLVPDPNGQVSNPVSKAYINRVTVATLGHEFQHLINASRRLIVRQTSVREETWLNEGLSHIAEELLFFRTASLAPRQNVSLTTVRSTTPILNAFNAYQIQNSGRMVEYLREVEASSPYADDDELATRGATYDYLRYALDRRNGDDAATLSALVNSNRRGMDNLQAVFGTAAPVRDWFRDWAVAHVTDDLTTTAPAAFTKPSWNWRSLLSGNSISNVYPLPVRSLLDNVPQSVPNLAGGSAAYLRFTVPAGQRATITTRGSGGAAVPAELRLSVVRTGAEAGNTTPTPAVVTTYGDGEGRDIQLSGNATSTATFTLVAFYADTNPTARTTVVVTGTGLGSPLAAVATAPSFATGPSIAALDAAARDPILTDAPVHARLRAIAERELGPAMQAAARASVDMRTGRRIVR